MVNKVSTVMGIPALRIRENKDTGQLLYYNIAFVRATLIIQSLLDTKIQPFAI